MKTTNPLLKHHVLSALLAMPILLGSTLVYADEAPAEPAVAAAPAEPASPHSVTFNLGLYSQYMFRGVALSDGPALQGGIDYAHSSGFYAGTWWSNIDKNFTGHGDGFSGGNKLETDWYAGYAKTFENGLGINVMGNYYYYPDRENSFSAGDVGRKQDSFEASIGLSYSYFTYTYYRVLTDYYGAAKDGTKDGKRDTDGAEYHELKMNYNLPIGGLKLMTKVGYQHTPNLTGSQGDFAIGLNRDFSLPSAGKPIEGFNAGAYYTDTFDVKNEAFYVTSDGRDTNQETVWFYVKRTW
ncbi:MAG: hypothetical protein HOP21_01475 [Methylotenera sp.]|nr:hypothetical protein [Methylotenera sp.]